ncbi:ABC transporter permease [Granulicoccus phenolivorans]|uniref:ABC transporter permease n=1 Tax=Granulicoccus phenolivorans TaxID=266854 RepID=UPI00042556F3|nr:ABC transporter permease [Granulicoccus phenolivorans]
MTETRAARRRRIRAYGDGPGVRAAALVVLIFLALPLVALVGSSFNPTPLAQFPPSGFSLRWYAAVLTSPDWLVSIQLSVLVAVLTIPSVVILATLTAYGLHRGRPKPLLTSFFMSPLIVSEVMVGLGLLTYLQGTGVLNTVTGLWLAHTLVTLPFAIRTVSISVQALDPMLERAGQSLGAGPLRVFFTVTLPQLRPGIIAGGIFAGVLSLGEVAVSTFVSGPNTTTVPLRIMSAVQFELDPSAAAVSTLLMVLSVVVMVVLSKWVDLSKAF